MATARGVGIRFIVLSLATGLEVEVATWIVFLALDLPMAVMVMADTTIREASTM